MIRMRDDQKKSNTEPPCPAGFYVLLDNHIREDQTILRDPVDWARKWADLVRSPLVRCWGSNIHLIEAHQCNFWCARQWANLVHGPQALCCLINKGQIP